MEECCCKSERLQLFLIGGEDWRFEEIQIVEIRMDSKSAWIDSENSYRCTRFDRRIRINRDDPLRRQCRPQSQNDTSGGHFAF